MTSPSNDAPQEAGFKAFLEHLIELRDRLLRIVIAIVAVFILLSPFVQDLYNWLSDPLMRYLPAGEKLIAIGVASPFLIPFKLALMVAFLLTLPYTFYQIWGFIAPGLYQHEKRLVTPLLLSSVGLFYVGMAFAYFLVIPMISKAAVAFAPSNVNPTPDIAAYLDFTVAMFLAFGLSFETPVATILLIGMGVVSVETLTKARPYIIVGAFVIAMFLTPPDVVSQILMAVPIWLLFELGLLLSRVFGKHLERFKVDKAQHDTAQTIHNDNLPVTTSVAAGAAAATAATTAWEDDQHIFEETVPVQSTDDDEFRPLTDAEMEAELERMDAEFKRMEDNFRQQEADGKSS
ncbi:MAG: twin arginine-targeting protein translocase TatC [Thiothrix lacustris]|uniref:Sec-independent protein translocase protein TatC n=1 Tax=Thiothrix lacustris TaxID=525917 RepID=A0A1Y1QVZ4_9GAMM|nr:MAG: twin arginine-targeting protein translocase TatC [Thiothrix lacustris]